MRVRAGIWWIWAALAIPSWPVVARFTGAAGVAIYSAVVFAALIASRRFVSSIRWERALALLWMLVIVVSFAVLYPRINVHERGVGSDDDDAHNEGVRALLAGESPYGHRTYLGNALHQLPGAYILSAPFTLIGTSALQNLVCLPLFFVVIKRHAGDARTAIVMAWLALVLSPSILFQVVTGSSYSWSAIWVLLGMWWLSQRPASVAAAILCGVAICSRPNFLLVVPLIYGWVRTYGDRVALRSIAVVIATAVILVLPFISAAEFGPAEGWTRLTQLDEIVPYAGIAILVATITAAAGLSFGITSLDALYQRCAIVLGLPVAAGIVLRMAAGDPAAAFKFAAYGSFASWFALMRSADALGADEASRPILQRKAVDTHYPALAGGVDELIAADHDADV